MVSGQELFIERERIKKSLDTSLRKAYENGIEMAQATQLYRMMLSNEIMRQKANGTPTTILEKLARGDEKVAKAEFNMIVAEVKYRASNENIMAQKKLFDSVEADIKREYYKGAEDG